MRAGHRAVRRTRAALLSAALLWTPGLVGCEREAVTSVDPPPPPTAAPLGPGPRPGPELPVAKERAAWLDLIALRGSATTTVGDAMVLNLASPAVRPFLALGHGAQLVPRKRVEGREAGWVLGKSVALDLPLDGPLSPALHVGDEERTKLAVAVTLHPLREDQAATITWNDQVLTNLRLGPGWQRRTFSVPATSRAGEQRLRIHFRRTTEVAPGVHAGAALAKLEVAPVETIRSGALADIAAGYATVPAEDGRSGLRLAAGQGLAYHLILPARSHLRATVSGAGRLQVLTSTDADHESGQPPVELANVAATPTRRELELEVAPVEGPIRLELRALGREGDAVVIRRAEIEPRPSSLARQPAPVLRDAIVVAVEGARADVVREMLDTGRLPVWRRLSDSSLVFDRAYAPGGAAVPVHAATLSSVAPSVHLTVRGTFVAPANDLLPEVLQRAGYDTSMIAANEDVTRERGLTQGIDRVLETGTTTPQRRAEKLVERYLQDGTRGERHFGYLVLSDPQAPYDPPRRLMAGIDTAGMTPPHLTQIWIGRVRLGKSVPSKDELAYIRRLYEAELASVDAALGMLVDTLRREGRLDSSVLVVVGVHGEEFFDHEGAGHGHSVHEELLRVPLLIRAPGQLEPGRVQTPVDLLDLGPTLAALLGVQPSPRWQGRSLLPLAAARVGAPRLVTASLGDGRRAAVVAGHKLRLGPGRAQAYERLASNGAEVLPLNEAGIALRVLRGAMAWYLAHEESWRRTRWGTPLDPTPAMATDLGL